MSGVRQHTIPRFLLRGFTSGQRRNGPVWYYRSNQDPIRVGIARVGVENHFYDNVDQTTADGVITAQEPDFANLVQNLRRCQTTTRVTDRLIPSLVQHLSARTQALRTWTTATLLKVFTFAGDHLLNPGNIQHVLSDTALTTQLVTERLQAMGLDEGLIAKLLPMLIADFPRLRGEWFTDVHQLITSLITGVTNEIPRQIRTGHNNALVALNDGPRADAYRRFCWHVVATGDPVLLGDSIVVVAVDGAQRFKSLDDATDTLRAVYLPLASYRVLVGAPDSAVPSLAVAELNRAVARCSYDFFISGDPVCDATLHTEIGLWAGLLSRAEVSHLLNDLDRQWPFKPARS